MLTTFSHDTTELFNKLSLLLIFIISWITVEECRLRIGECLFCVHRWMVQSAPQLRKTLLTNGDQHTPYTADCRYENQRILKRKINFAGSVSIIQTSVMSHVFSAILRLRNPLRCWYTDPSLWNAVPHYTVIHHCNLPIYNHAKH